MGIYLHQSVAVSFTGALAFGLYFATLLICLRWLLFVDESWKFKKNIRWVTVTITLLIFASNVVYLSMSLHGTMLSAQYAASNPPGVPFNGPSWISIVACTAANCSVLLADIVLIYRCWIIYEKRPCVVVFPLFLWLSALVCTLLQIYLQIVHTHDPNIGPYTWASVNMTFGPGIVLLPFWISTVILNAYSSGISNSLSNAALLTFLLGVLLRRIYCSAEEFQLYAPVRHLHLLVRAIAESGFLYLSVTLAHLLIWFGKSDLAINIIGILASCNFFSTCALPDRGYEQNAPIVGIAFNWFLIRLERNKARFAAEADGQVVSAMQFGKNSAHGMIDTTFSTVSPDTT